MYDELCYRKHAMRAAKDLGYGDEVIEKIEKAEDDHEIQRIMKSARIKSIEEDEE